MGVLRIRDAEELEVQRLWDKSPQASVFTFPRVTNELSSQVNWILCSKGEEAVLAWPVTRNAAGVLAPPQLTYFVGPLWSQSASIRPVTSQLKIRLQVYEELCDYLFAEYGGITADLHPSVTDVRPFLWWNIDSELSPHLDVNPKYTAQLRNLQVESEGSMLAQFRELRRREVRRVAASGEFHREALTRLNDAELGQMTRLYRATLERAIQPDSWTSLERQLVALSKLVADGYGFFMVTRNSHRDKGQIVAITLNLVMRQESHLVLNLVDAEFRSSGVAAWNMFNTVIEAKRQGVETFDFNGANSPRRGDDKHSYGAKEVLYFQVQTRP
jgi:hypothetical protein